MNPRVVKTEAADERLTPPATAAAPAGGGGPRAPVQFIELSSSDSDSDGGVGGSAKRSRSAAGDSGAGKRARVSAGGVVGVDVPPGFLDPLPAPPQPSRGTTKQFWKAGDYDGNPAGGVEPPPSGIYYFIFLRFV